MPDFPTTRSISPLQAAMLRGSLARTCGENVEQVEMDFPVGLEMDRVIAAWTATVERTSALRTGFVFRDGDPTDILAVRVETPVRSELTIPENWDGWLANDRLQPLLVNGGLPWRAVLWPAARKLVWTFHHALLDGRSITSILRSFQARLIGADDPGDLELANRPPASADEVAEALDFHQSAFARLENLQPEFPADQGKTPARVHRCLGVEMVTRIESVARRMETSSPTLVTWAWGQAVATAAGADAVAVGQVRAGPPTPGQAGFTMNTVPLVIPRTAPESAAKVLSDFRKHLHDMRSIENTSPQDLPPGTFEQAGGPWPGGVLMVEHGTLHHQVGKTAVIESITLHESSGEPLLASAWIHPDLRLEVEVNGNPYGTRMAESLLDHWAATVTAIAEDSSTHAGDLTTLPATMRDALSRWETGGEAAAHLHLATAWREAAESFSSHCALWVQGTAVSYAELAAQVDHLAARLQEAGVKRGHNIASMLKARSELAVAVLALARLGAINIPLDPILPEQRLRSIIEETGPVMILCDHPDACAKFHLPTLAMDGASGKTCTAEIPCDPRETLAILYTSGSTGVPKGVMMVHGGVTNEARGIARLAGIGPGDRVLQFASPGFDTCIEELLATLLSGATLVPRPDELEADLNQFQGFIQTAGITVLDLTTAHWAAWCAWMVSENEIIPENLRVTIIGGERASAAAVKNWFSVGGRQHRLVNTYGPTEASIVGTAELITGDWNASGDPAIGRPLPGVFARIGDSSGRTLPHGAAGELWLGGICVGPGYWNQPDLTAAAFRSFDGRWWYRTGDRVFRDDDGRLHFLGRRDEQLKIRGNRVEPNEVKRVLEAFPGVSAAHAGPVPGQAGASQLAAWVCWNHPPAEGWPALLAEHAAIHLPAAAIPTRWAAVDEFKLTERGKLDRHQLPDSFLTSSAHVSSDPPATPTELRLARLWSGLLGVETIGRDESFFELGGHSLAALHLFSSIAREWKIRIPMATLILSPSLRLLGEIIDRECGGHHARRQARSVVVPVRPDGHLAPLFCIHGGDGGVFFYNDLAAHLPPGRPLLAIESPALAANEEVRPVPVETTATAYVAALRDHQAKGPFHLAGYSYGGLLVFEIARQLIAEGESVAFAGLFDTVNPAAPIREYTLLERAAVFWEAHDHPNLLTRIGRLLARARDGLTTHLRVKKEIRSAREAGNTEPHSDLRMLQVREAHWKSMQLYQPAPLNCHITLFKSQATDDKFDIPDDYGWGSLVKSIDIVEVEGEHLTMFNRRHIRSLAREIAQRL
jgi:amino acid adenylation domain-containing protein